MLYLRKVVRALVAKRVQRKEEKTDRWKGWIWSLVEGVKETGGRSTCSGAWGPAPLELKAGLIITSLDGLLVCPGPTRENSSRNLRQGRVNRFWGTLMQGWTEPAAGWCQVGTVLWLVGPQCFLISIYLQYDSGIESMICYSEVVVAVQNPQSYSDILNQKLFGVGILAVHDFTFLLQGGPGRP